MSTSVETLPPGERKHACTGCTAPKAEFKLGIHVFGGGHTNTTFFCAPCLNALVQQGANALADMLTNAQKARRKR